MCLNINFGFLKKRFNTFISTKSKMWRSVAHSATPPPVPLQGLYLGLTGRLNPLNPHTTFLDHVVSRLEYTSSYAPERLVIHCKQCCLKQWRNMVNFVSFLTLHFIIQKSLHGIINEIYHCYMGIQRHFT